jgi:hypothetical protein
MAGECTLSSCYPNLYSIAVNPTIIVAIAFQKGYLDLKFIKKNKLVGTFRNEWTQLHTEFYNYLPPSTDVGTFLLKIKLLWHFHCSLFLQWLTQLHTDTLFTDIVCASKISLKI